MRELFNILINNKVMEELPDYASQSFIYDLERLPDDMTIDQVLERYQETGLIRIKNVYGEVVEIEPVKYNTTNRLPDPNLIPKL